MANAEKYILYYKVETSAFADFTEAATFRHETGDFSLRIDQGLATFQLKATYGSVIEARAAVEEFTRSWEIDIAMKRQVPILHFAFDRAKIIINGKKSPESTPTIYAQGVDSAAEYGTPSLRMKFTVYPDLPAGFTVTPDAETLWNRWESYRDGHEPLMSMAYFCLTFIEWSARAHGSRKAKGRDKASQMYRIHIDVLSKLGHLTGNTGDLATARKLTPKSTLKPTSNRERQWVRAAVLAIVRRSGELTSGPNLPMITMHDLPKL